MIDKWEDLDLQDDHEMDVDKFESVVDSKIQEKLGISLISLKEKLSDYVVEHASILVKDFSNIAPLGDYSTLIETHGDMVSFFKDEAHKVEHWKLHRLEVSNVSPNLLVFEFANNSIDDGDVCAGFVYVSFQGKVKHAFAQGDV